MPTCYKVNIYKTERKNDNSYQEIFVRTDLVRNYLLFAKSYEDNINYPILKDEGLEESGCFEENFEDLNEITYYINNDIYSIDYFKNPEHSQKILATTILGDYQILPKSLIGKEYVKKSELTKDNAYFAETLFDDLSYDEEKPTVLVKK